MPKTNYRNEPIYWFSILERAVENGDFVRAAHARRELERLGVCVDYRPLMRIRREVATHGQ